MKDMMDYNTRCVLEWFIFVGILIICYAQYKIVKLKYKGGKK